MSDFLLPVDDNYVTILGIMNALELNAAKELATYLDNQFKAQGNPDWFEDIRHYRLANNEPFSYRAPNDLRFILGEATLGDSQIWHLIPGINQMWMNAADNLRKKLNQLHHLQLSPDLNTLFQVASLFQQVTESPGLEVSAWARALKTRVQDILSGSFVKPSTQSPAPVVPEEAKEIKREYEAVRKEFEKRPPWGARWTGPKPARKLLLDRNTLDIYDDNGVSVKHELGEMSNQVTDMWLRYFPRGGEVFVDEDGAAMGYIKGLPKMIGWFGPAPDEESSTVRGFVLPREFEFDGSDVRDLESGALLSRNAGEPIMEHLALLAKTVPPGARLNITDYGDLFVPVIDGEPIRITRMHKGIWFPGQLPG